MHAFWALAPILYAIHNMTPENPTLAEKLATAIADGILNGTLRPGVRLDEIGLDFAIIYPTGGLRVPRVGADRPRRAAARAYAEALATQPAGPSPDLASRKRFDDAVRRALEITPPELASDIVDRGIVMTGGGALIRGLDLLLSQETSLPIHVDEDPLTCVVRGTGRILDDEEKYWSVLSS